MDAPAHPGCLIGVRLIGIIEAEQTEEGKTESNDQLTGVAVHSYSRKISRRSTASAKLCYPSEHNLNDTHDDFFW